MDSGPNSHADLAERLRNITEDLKQVESVLVSERLDSAVLTDFRDAVNRVRTTAWAVQQYLDSDTNAEQSASVLALLANERVRVTYRLCRVIDADLANYEMSSGTLVQLYLATQDLAQRLSEQLGREGRHAPQSEKAAAEKMAG